MLALGLPCRFLRSGDERRGARGVQGFGKRVQYSGRWAVEDAATEWWCRVGIFSLVLVAVSRNFRRNDCTITTEGYPGHSPESLEDVSVMACPMWACYPCSAHLTAPRLRFHARIFFGLSGTRTPLISPKTDHPAACSPPRTAVGTDAVSSARIRARPRAASAASCKGSVQDGERFVLEDFCGGVAKRMLIVARLALVSME